MAKIEAETGEKGEWLPSKDEVRLPNILTWNVLSLYNVQKFIACKTRLGIFRAATVAKVWSLPRFWVSIRSFKKQSVKKIWGRILDLVWLKFDVAVLILFAAATLWFLDIIKSQTRGAVSDSIC